MGPGGPGGCAGGRSLGPKCIIAVRVITHSGIGDARPVGVGSITLAGDRDRCDPRGVIKLHAQDRMDRLPNSAGILIRCHLEPKSCISTGCILLDIVDLAERTGSPKTLLPKWQAGGIGRIVKLVRSGPYPAGVRARGEAEERLI